MFNHRSNTFNHRFNTLSPSIITIKNHCINQEFKNIETFLPTTVDDIIDDTDMKMKKEDFWIEYLTEIKMYIIYIYLKIKIKFYYQKHIFYIILMRLKMKFILFAYL